ncbi:SDR family NAD(P)-dependent oxidoreductase [Planctomicrobium sp. SH527]|uniref:SDR family NAD(P)-dependent oxidoreductase n=1 Tax=Planctomicrobium sp. SH527 TaxID=3448123 RepID=UPI003F5CB9F7
MFQYKGKTALVTGASSGIGAEFARELSRRGMNVILVARSEERLATLATEIRQQFPTRAEVIAADLRQESAVQDITQAVSKLGLTVDLLINNAGFMTHGAFENIDPAVDHAEVMVNVAAVVGLTHAFLPGMLERKLGGVINIASVAGFQPIPYLAVYAATKAFVISFSVALSEECRDRNVVVMGMCPGTTSTELFTRASAQEAALGTPRSVKQVVATALKGLDKKRSLVTDGTMNSLLTHGPRLIPRWFAARCAGKAVRPKGKSK